MMKSRVGVMRGGPSPEYEVSLKTGATVLQHLPRDKYEVFDLFIDKEGEWHMRGKPMEPARALEQVDVVFNALHGKYGEDGILQRYMDMHKVRYTGTDALGSGIAMHKVLTKRRLAEAFQGGGYETPLRERESMFARHVQERLARMPHLQHSPTYAPNVQARSSVFTGGVSMREASARKTERGARILFPADVVLEAGADLGHIESVFERLSPPLVVKPVNGGSSIATSVVRSREELLCAVLLAFEESDRVLVEQFVRGREVTVGVMEDYRNEALYAFPPVEIIPTKSKWFDYDEKYAGHAREVCPAPLKPEVTTALLELARNVHRTLGLRDYSRSDFILGSDGIYFLETNTLPGLTATSLFPKAMQAVGALLPHVLDHITTRALER